MILVIVESPSKCKIIESYLGDQYRCVATCGHIREIPDLKAIDKETLLPTYTMLSNKYITALKKEIKKHKEIVIATDNDREGEAIAWHICDAFKLPLTTPRIVFNEITETCVLRAIQTPTVINMSLVKAQQCRQILDMFLGYKISPLLWKHISRNTEKSLSAGRCQTPALRIIYDNHKLPTTQRITSSIKGYFTSQNILFEMPIEEESIPNFFAKAATFSFSINHSYIQIAHKPPPSPFTTSRILQSLSMSSREILQGCCKLYEKGYITYPRTSSTFYAASFLTQMRDLITKKYGENYVSPKLSLLTQTTHPHEAIRPTNISLKSLAGDVPPKENRIYELIWKNTVESCMSEAVVHSFQSSLTTPIPFKVMECTSRLIVFPGWYAVQPKQHPQSDTYHFLKNIPTHSFLGCKKLVSDFHIESVDPRYTEASLIRKLETLGIGRPSTFASLVSILQDRKYVVKQDIEGTEVEKRIYEWSGDILTHKMVKKQGGFEKNKLQITHMGIIVMEFCLKYFATLFDYQYTKTLEEQLENAENLDNLCHEYVDNIEHHISSLNATGMKGKEEIIIDDENKLIIGRTGSVIVTNDENGTTFTKVKQNIDLDKLREGTYTMEEIRDTSNTFHKGSFMGEELFIKNGRYGIYTTWRGKNVSLHYYKKVPIEKITLENVVWAIRQNARKYNFTELF
jgi:DNA topoisomerase-1